MKKALLLIAHGSRRQQSNDEVVLLADKLKKNCAGQYDIIHAGFLELAETLIPDGIKKCVDDGATSIVVLPYFLNSGRHVIEDIPEIVDETKASYPETDIKVAPHLGASELMMDLLISTANSAG
jgi:sirohydrochlorin ferrochelatase